MKKRIWILTLLPDMFKPFIANGITGSALRGERSQDSSAQFELKVVSLSDFSAKSFKGVDSAPYGGGAGMVLRADVLRDALIKGVVEAGGYGEDWRSQLKVICPAPRGRKWDATEARNFANDFLSFHVDQDLVFICGRYEGIDERFLEKYVDHFFSVGDYILTGGELAVMVMIDSSIRFVPGILGNKISANDESFEDGLIEHPFYTRPQEFEGESVPEVLMSGDAKKIDEFYFHQKIRMTQKWRPDLYKKYIHDLTHY